MPKVTSKAVRIASSHVITSCATLAAILLFVGLGSQVLSPAFGARLPDQANTLQVAFLLNIAIILFGWRRSNDLKIALVAYEEADRAAQRNANTDPATGLANRRELMRCLGDAVNSNAGGVLLLLDLDHFKRVNDLYGHLSGDRILRGVADALRKGAPNALCLARIGGDEFAVLHPQVGADAAQAIAQAILKNVEQPVEVDGGQVQVSGSVGLAWIERGASEEDVLRRSDVALYAAKRAGRNGFSWFDRELDRELAERLRLEEDIRTGIKKGEFVPFFQPLIDLTTRELIGFEALARWRSPTRGFIEAENFLQAAESTGLIAPLTLTVIEQAMREARKWPGDLKLAVNFSPIQFSDRSLAEQIAKILTATGFPANRLEIEITEASLLEGRDQALTIIHSLKNLGVSISLDDFGTGYAALAQVNSLPVDRIKIDRSFITHIVKSDQTAAIVNTIANLGHSLNVPITAEGVESEQIRSELQRIGCSQAQGWLFGRAVSAESVRSFLGMDGMPEDPAASPPPADEDPARFVPRIRRAR